MQCSLHHTKNPILNLYALLTPQDISSSFYTQFGLMKPENIVILE